MGNIGYNYFEGKEAIFESILRRLYAAFTSDSQPLIKYNKESSFPEDLEGFGSSVGKMVEDHADYLTHYTGMG